MWSRRQIPSWKGNRHLSCMTHLETQILGFLGFLGYPGDSNAIECTQKWIRSPHHNGNGGLDVFILHTFFRAVRHQCQELTSPVPSCLHDFNTHFKAVFLDAMFGFALVNGHVIEPHILRLQSIALRLPKHLHPLECQIHVFTTLFFTLQCNKTSHLLFLTCNLM